jgi:hypothetical protein
MTIQRFWIMLAVVCGLVIGPTRSVSAQLAANQTNGFWQQSTRDIHVPAEL